jgi:4-amino-4-deoxy-L-arabinose transferase-like glycosyltransferase
VLIYGGGLALFGPHLFIIRLVTLGFSLGLLLVTYRIGCILYDRATGLWAAGALLVTPFFFRVGTTALNDMPVAFWFTFAVFLTLRLLETPTYRRALGLGLCIGMGLLCKYTMLLVCPVVLLIVLLQGQWRRVLAPLAVAAVVSLVIFGGWIVTAAQLGVFAEQQKILSRYAAHVVTSNKGKWWLVGVLTLRLPSGIGVYMLPLLFVGVGHLLKQRSRSDLVVVGWVLAVFLPLIFMLPGPRYFLPAFPALAIMMARGLILFGEEKPRMALMALLSWGGALYLFVDWYRAAGELFPR